MRALSFCEQFCPEKIDIKPVKELGTGADGSAYLTEDSSVVIKFGVLKNDATDNYEKDIYPVLNLLISYPVDAFARVYAHKYLGTFFQDSHKYILYYYTMEKLEEISADEMRVFHTTVSHEDNNKKKDYSIREVRAMLRNMARSLDFDDSRMISFHKALKKAPINHSDICPRNIMKNKMGNFHLIDFDRCQLKLPRNP
jgi:hypothetical protein